MVDELVYLRTIILHVPSEHSGSAASNITFSSPRDPMIFATAFVRQEFTFSAVPSDSIMII